MTPPSSVIAGLGAAFLAGAPVAAHAATGSDPFALPSVPTVEVMVAPFICGVLIGAVLALVLRRVRRPRETGSDELRDIHGVLRSLLDSTDLTVSAISALQDKLAGLANGFDMLRKEVRGAYQGTAVKARPPSESTNAPPRASGRPASGANVLEEYQRVTEAMLDCLGRLIDQRFPVRHPIQAIAESNARLDRQIAVLHTIDTQWREHLVERLVRGNAEALRSGMVPLVEGMNRMADRVGELSRESMERMIGAFTRRLDDSLRGYMDELAERLRMLCTSYQSLTDTVQGIDASLALTLENSSKALSEGVFAASARIEEALHNGGAGLIGGLTESQKALTDAAAETSQRLQDRLTDMVDQFAARLEETGSILRASLNEVDTAVQGSVRNFVCGRAVDHLIRPSLL